MTLIGGSFGGGRSARMMDDDATSANVDTANQQKHHRSHKNGNGDRWDGDGSRMKTVRGINT